MPIIWDLLSNQSIANLVRLQYKHYPDVKLFPPNKLRQPITVIGKMEDVEEIDQIMRQAPMPNHGGGE